jgi:ABC-2 type transport system permease protein
MNPRIAFAIARKDIVDAIKNTYIFISLLLPVGMSLLFGLILPSGGSASAPVIAVYAPGGATLVDRLAANQGLKLTVVDSAAAARDATKNGGVGIILPEGFDEALANGERPTIEILYQGATGAVIEAAVQRAVESLLRDMAGQKLPAVIQATNAAGESGGAASSFAFSHYLLILFVVMGLAITGVFVVPTLLVEEKEKHTLEAVLATPAGYPDLVAGKALVGLTYSLLSAVILLALNGGFSGYVPVSLAAVFLGALLMVLIGLFLGAIFSTSAQVNTWSTMVMLLLLLPAMLTSGLPVPAAVRAIDVFLPSQYITDALTIGLNRGSLAGAGVDLAILAGCCVVAFVGVVWVLRRERL